MEVLRYLFFILLTTLLACQQPTSSSALEKETDSLFTFISSDDSGIDFNNIFKETVTHNGLLYEYIYNGGGVAIGDINNDQLPDLFFTGNQVENELYLNKGNLKFEKISKQAGIQSDRWSSGAVMADVNEDGLLDIYVCNQGPDEKGKKRVNQLYINNGDLTFSEKAEQYGIADSNTSTQAVFFDYDKDGDLDLYVLNHSPLVNATTTDVVTRIKEVVAHSENVNKLRKSSSTLYRNNGNQTFTDVTLLTGIAKFGYGLGVVASDLNKDGWVDLYVANDYHIPDFYFINQKNGTFKDVVKEAMGHVPFFAMGCDAADINNDGYLDLAVVDMTPEDHIKSKTSMSGMNPRGVSFLTEKVGFQHQYMFNAFQLNRGNGLFSNIGFLAKTAKTDWSWSTLLADYNNNGYKDYFVSNGYYRMMKDNDFRIKISEKEKASNFALTNQDYFNLLQTSTINKVPNYFFENNGNLEFIDRSSSWMEEIPSLSSGAAYSDLDRDGDLDLVVNNINDKAFVLRNEAEQLGNHFLIIQLEDRLHKNATYNAKVTIYTKDELQFVEMNNTRGYQSAIEPNIVHFGLGKKSQVDSVVVEWLDGTKSKVTNVSVNKKLVINKEKALAVNSLKSSFPPFLRSYPLEKIGITYQHKENVFDDFEKEILLPHKQSQMGPALAVADANGDGLEDIYIGGAKGQSGSMFGQNSNGSFSPVIQELWQQYSSTEEIDALFFDADQDGDQDLYIACGGGGEFQENDSNLQDRLYINGGKGNYAIALNALPTMNSNSSIVRAADFDSDGDIDLFVGGRGIPGKYPLPDRSFLLRNDGNKFSDVTEEWINPIRQSGMIHDAIWTDFNKDNKIDLIVVGEWMPIRFFENTGNTFKEVTSSSGMDHSNGWWYAIEKVDWNKDGLPDYVVGNVGKNLKFKASEEKPLKIYADDFDQSGSFDVVLSTYYKGNEVPVRGRQCSSEQMPFIKDKFPSFQSFAEAGIKDILGKEEVENATNYKAYHFESILLLNKGKGNFDWQPLPNIAQIAPIKDILVKDITRDGNPDLLLVGNMFEAEVETPRYAAGKGLVIKGNSSNQLQPLTLLESGFHVPNNARKIAPIAITERGHLGILVANNNNVLQLFTANQETKIIQ